MLYQTWYSVLTTVSKAANPSQYEMLLRPVSESLTKRGHPAPKKKEMSIGLAEVRRSPGAYCPITYLTPPKYHILPFASMTP
jgi:hypothetical protein